MKTSANLARKNPRYYVGMTDTGREVFRSPVTPTPEKFPNYWAAIGPFRTKRGAEFMARYGENNPHLQDVSDAERIAKKYQGVRYAP